MGAEHVVVLQLGAGDTPPRELRHPGLASNSRGDEALASSLRESLTRLTTPFNARELEEVRELVSQYVVALHNREWPPERAITAVKQVARDAGLRASASQALAESQWTDSDKLLAELVRWCIAQYYDSPVAFPVVRASTKARAEAPHHT
jgi:hypothetical protein